MSRCLVPPPPRRSAALAAAAAVALTTVAMGTPARADDAAPSRPTTAVLAVVVTAHPSVWNGSIYPKP